VAVVLEQGRVIRALWPLRDAAGRKPAAGDVVRPRRIECPPWLGDPGQGEDGNGDERGDASNRQHD
jgi:hypothetical protein